MFFIFFHRNKTGEKTQSKQKRYLQKAVSEQRLLKGMPKFSIGENASGGVSLRKITHYKRLKAK